MDESHVGGDEEAHRERKSQIAESSRVRSSFIYKTKVILVKRVREGKWDG